MEHVDGPTPSPPDAHERLGEFIDVLRRLHSHEGFAGAVAEAGVLEPLDFSYRRWAEDHWSSLRPVGVDGDLIDRGRGWLAAVASEHAAQEPRDSITVATHGDLHLPNWKLTGRGPVLLDWDEILRIPLAQELADFIVWAALDPAEVAKRYGVPSRYSPAIVGDARACALGLLGQGLQQRAAGRAEPTWFDHVLTVCERTFALPAG
ncbi:MAG: phosphotransferase [Dehalococcoidia bacterium]|jgi:aminoglycoside phosphotransferase (APT) family kinase protein|nr:phosphotransferase [Dehalococcoidia bacterium]